jgi:hypothetical protein
MVVIFSTVILSGCLGSRLFWKDCGDIDLAAVEEVISSLETKGKIRHDQAVARKKDMRKSWDSYIKGQLTCEELRQKALYHTDGTYPDK